MNALFVFFIPFLIIPLSFVFSLRAVLLTALVLHLIHLKFFFSSGLLLVPFFITGLVFAVLRIWKGRLEDMKRENGEHLGRLREHLQNIEKKAKRLKKEYERLEEDLQVERDIYQFSQKVAPVMKSDQILDILREALEARFEIGNAAVYLYENKFDLWLASPGSEAAFRRMLEKFKQSGEGEHDASHHLIPLRTKKEILGALMLETDNRLIGKLGDLVLQLTLGLQNAALCEAVEKMARTDGLTGAFRRGYFETRLEEEIRRAERFRYFFTLMMLDIDDFKKYNDAYGHPIGDHLLQKIAELIKTNTYETDFIARYGGEEFAIIMPSSSREGARKKAESLRGSIARAAFPIGEDITIHLTVSIGLAHFPESGRTKETLIKSADTALYRAKAEGKNQVCEAGPEFS
ncbi:MAG TPA: diguanylate cyclase [bacterium]|nr:diguanylate cyclase [bacterium]